ncbi:hypothetical protein WMF45_38000 [Sorangium sp. So ce448]|uniref:hypothetical protein n=1 Tax=Sorangium sp. So ce448 TaxID=3133314 RepID=UPI003F5EA2DB
MAAGWIPDLLSEATVAVELVSHRNAGLPGISDMGRGLVPTAIVRPGHAPVNHLHC